MIDPPKSTGLILTPSDLVGWLLIWGSTFVANMGRGWVYPVASNRGPG